MHTRATQVSQYRWEGKAEALDASLAQHLRSAHLIGLILPLATPSQWVSSRFYHWEPSFYAFAQAGPLLKMPLLKAVWQRLPIPTRPSSNQALRSLLSSPCKTFLLLTPPVAHRLQIDHLPPALDRRTLRAVPSGAPS